MGGVSWHLNLHLIRECVLPSCYSCSSSLREKTGLILYEVCSVCSPPCLNLSPWLFFFNLFIFNWRIIVLQYCVGFCHPSTFPPDFMFVHKAVWYNDIYQRSAVFLYDSRKLISSVQSLSYIWLFATPWTAAHQASLSITDSQSLLKLMSIESVIPSNHLILFCPLLLPSVFPCIRVFSSELALHISYWSFSFNISPSHEYSGLISFRMDWLDLKKLITGPQSPHRVCQASPLCPPRLML